MPSNFSRQDSETAAQYLSRLQSIEREGAVNSEDLELFQACILDAEEMVEIESSDDGGDSLAEINPQKNEDPRAYLERLRKFESEGKITNEADQLIFDTFVVLAEYRIEKEGREKPS